MLTEGGGGVQEPFILADVICEQPLTVKYSGFFYAFPNENVMLNIVQLWWTC